jgi:glucosamine kinase
MPRFLGLDVGGSATRWTLVDSRGDIQASGEVAGFSAGLPLPNALASAKLSFDQIRRQLDRVQSVTAGITGLNRGSDAASQIAHLIADIFTVRDVNVMSDIELQHRAHFPPGRGILVYCGTGSIAGHVSASGQLQTAGGRGVIIDDAGGGYWIATAGLRTVLRLEDRSPHDGWSTQLGRSLSILLGGADWPTVKTAIASRSRGEIALLARCVADAARKGDPLAIGILRQAGAELALIADMLFDRVGFQPVILTGRASELHGEIISAMREALPHATIAQRFADASVAAARIAHGGDHG